MLTQRVLWLVGFALLPALGIQAYNEFSLRASREEAVRTDVMRTAADAAEDLSGVAEAVREGLAFVAKEDAIRGKDPEACARYLAENGGNIPGVVLLALTEPDGRVICNSRGTRPGAYSNAQRPYHRRALAEGRLSLGDYAEGVATGERTIHLAEPLRDARGEAIGVLVAAIDLRWLAERLDRSRLPRGTVLSVFDPAGRILVRRPEHDLWVGRQIDPSRFAEIKANVGVAREAVSFDGRPSIAGVVRPAGVMDGLVVSAGRERAVAFADIDAATRRGLILILLGATLAFAAALVGGRLLISRPVRRLLRAATSWRDGDLTARTGVAGRAEFGQLGEAFDGMAAALERHEHDLRSEIARGLAMQEQQSVMLHELNHRVKNTLATVQSLARQAHRGEGVPGGAESLERRILALSKTHDLLTRDAWTGADLREMLEGELGPYRNSADHCSLDGPDLQLAARQVLALGMTIHELTTNAAKHGALSTADGHVAVSWTVRRGEGGGRRLELTWQESGGPVVLEPTRRGFGTRLIAGGIQRELDGEVALSFEPGGLLCRIAVPLAEPGVSMLSPTLPT